MRAVFASFGATLLAAVALSAQATPSQQQQIEIDHCTIMSKAVLEFAKARDQGLAKMDAYNSVTGNQPYRAGSMVDQTLQWAYDHADENAEAVSAHFYGHCSLDALEALTPETEEQSKTLAAACQQQNAARPDETRICMDQKISALIVAANAPPGLAPTSATAVAPRPARAKVQTLSSAQLAVASAPPVRAPVAAPEPAPQAPVRLVQTPVPVSAPAPMVAATPSPKPMLIPAPVHAKPAVPPAPATAVAAAPAPLEPTVVPASQPAEVAAPERLAQAPTPVPSATTTPVTAPEPVPVAQPAVTPVVVAQAPAPVPPPLPAPVPVKAPQPTPVAPAPRPVVAQVPTPISAPAPVVAQAVVPVKVPEPVKVAVTAPAASATEPKLAVLSPPSLGSVGKLTLGMSMYDAEHTFHSFGEEDRDEFGAETQTFLISDGHGYVVLLTEKGKPDTLYGIEYHGGADADTAPTIMGVRLGQSALAVLTHVGDPSRRERLPNSEFTRWYYDGRNYSFDISSGGDLVAIRLYGYQGLQAPDADSDSPAPAPVTP